MMTDEEREFLMQHQGGVFAKLIDTIEGTESATPKREAGEAAAELLRRIEEAVPNRAQRLLILSEAAKLLDDARNSLLDTLLGEDMEWRKREEPRASGEWYAVGYLQPYEVEHMASLAGRSVRMVKQRHKDLLKRAWDNNKEKDS